MTRTFPALLVLLLASCAPPPQEPVADTTRPAEAVGPERDAPFQDGTVHYLDRGQGERALVLIHGWASDVRVWREELERSPAGRRVLAIDLPGHGGSSEPGGTYSMDLFADAIAAVMDHAGVRSAVLVGHSNGTPVVRQFYRRHPERTLALVAVDGPLKQMFDPAQLEPFVAAFSGEGWREAAAGFVDSMPAPRVSAEWRTELRAMAQSQTQGATLGGLVAASEPSIWESDPIEVPLLLLLAEQPSWTPEYEASVRELAPDVDYRVWGEGTGHFLMLERPDDFHAALDEFLAGHDLL